MTSLNSNLSGRLVSAVLIIVSFTAAPGSAADTPKPTPRPGTLGAYALKVTLDRSALSDRAGRVILTNDNVVGLGEGATITLGAVAPAGPKKSKPSGGADNAERSRWQAAHRSQRQVIFALERRRSQLETEIDQIEDLGLTVRTMARLERAESKLRHLDEEIARERSALARIVRDARRRGAEPGWFR
jgi:hypothetical protein